MVGGLGIGTMGLQSLLYDISVVLDGVDLGELVRSIGLHSEIHRTWGRIGSRSFPHSGTYSFGFANLYEYLAMTFPPLLEPIWLQLLSEYKDKN